MAPDSTLCEYCSHIDFDLLRHPTAAEIRSMNAGDRPSGDRFPLKHHDTTGQIAPMWSLGLLSRIRKSAASCSFCETVVTVLQQQRHQLDDLVAVGVDDPFCIAACGFAATLMPPEGITWKSVRSEEGGDVFHLRRLELGFRPATSGSVGPGPIDTIHKWKRLVACFQTYHPESDTGFSKMENVFGKAEDADTVFCGQRDAHAGLPEISRPRGGSQETVTIRKPGSTEDTCLLTALKPPDKDFAAHPTAGTTWSTRGWTLQERALTRRAVIFLEEQLLWVCCTAQFSEETSSEVPTVRVTWNNSQQSEYYLNSGFQNLMGSDSENDQMWLRLSQLVLDYTQRNLKFQGDSYDAFSAIPQQAQEFSGEQFLWGIPTSRFESGLCWEPAFEGLTRRTGLTTREVTVGFTSGVAAYVT
ncbi:tol protein-like protein [Colletotrichum sojae]|uniref:Tol protein-like protein n=1 Tax=Colletotrichum sojae TaxID=2175907 RepID=A0A8H6MMM4_9PEZI|nr:tol protein-like protein [Colletotrichum sojae]